MTFKFLNPGLSSTDKFHSGKRANIMLVRGTYRLYWSLDVNIMIRLCMLDGLSSMTLIRGNTTGRSSANLAG